MIFETFESPVLSSEKCSGYTPREDFPDLAEEVDNLEAGLSRRRVCEGLARRD